MPDPIATPNDVRSRINLPDAAEGEGGVSDRDISTYLEDATFDLAQVNDLDTIDPDVREQLEWRLAAIDILSTRRGSRAPGQESIGSAQRSFEENMVDTLREKVAQICTANDLTNPIARNTLGGVQRDSERYVRATNPEDD